MHAPVCCSLSQHKQNWIARSFDSIRLHKRAARRSKACRSKSSSTQTTVDRELPKQKHPGLVLTTGPSEAWDHTAVGNPVVRCYLGDNEQRWYMWYSGNNASGRAVDAISPCSGSTGVATSSNGVDWTRVPSASSAAPSATAAEDKKKSGPKGQGCVMQPGEDWWTFDTCHMAVSDVQILSNNAVATGVGVYWMFYSGASHEDVEAPEGFPGLQAHDSIEGLRMRPGLAMSQDGLNWARIEGEHHTGAILDVGEAGEWDELFIANPQVVAAGPGDMRMYYHSFDKVQRRFVVGWASSPDGFKWTKQGPMFSGSTEAGAFDARGIAACNIVRDLDTKKFVMWYEGVAEDNSRSIGMAVSNDGISGWKRWDRPVLTCSDDPEAWDRGSVGTPCPVSMAGGSWRLYYSGRQGSSGAWTGIGMALTSSDSEEVEGIKISFKRRGQA
ncbi:hypothetical protein WJX82_008147 [Trebouxia sp. C0006]